MKKIVLLFIFAILLITTAVFFYFWQRYKGLYFANKPSNKDVGQLIQNSLIPGQNNTSFPLKIPNGYTLSLYAQGLTNARAMVLDPNGNIVVSLTSGGMVKAIVDGNVITVVDKLKSPHGLAFYENKLYVAETNQISIYDYDPTTHKASNKKKIIDLPSGGIHFTRSLLIKGKKLYVSSGSSCNACIETDSKRAAIWVADLDGANFQPFATGLRNSVFMTVNPETDEIWATNMGRDLLGDDTPPDTVNIIKKDANYGWPYCYGDRIIDSEINPGGNKFDCSRMALPQIKVQAHSAPLGLAFLGQDLLIAFHGSWNRTIPTGYKVVKVHNGVQEDFIAGWLEADGNVLGRPVDILIKEDEIYISDDKAGVIYLLKPN